MAVNSALSALHNVLPAHVQPRKKAKQGPDLVVEIKGTSVRIRQLDRGWPRQAREALRTPPRPDVLFAPIMSPGAKVAAAAGGVGWLDAFGGAEIVIGSLIVSRSSAVPPQETVSRWTPSVQAVAEALLMGVRATVSSVVNRTRLSEGAVTNALSFLSQQGLLVGDAQRGRRSGRRVKDQDLLLDAYSEHAAKSTVEVQMGVVWRDPLAEAVRLGEIWSAAAGLRWAATSALAAAVLAPWLTQISPLEIYVKGGSVAELTVAASKVGLFPVEGGRLRLRSFLAPVPRL